MEQKCDGTEVRWKWVESSYVTYSRGGMEHRWIGAEVVGPSKGGIEVVRRNRGGTDHLEMGSKRRFDTTQVNGKITGSAQ